MGPFTFTIQLEGPCFVIFTDNQICIQLEMETYRVEPFWPQAKRGFKTNQKQEEIKFKLTFLL